MLKDVLAGLTTSFAAISLGAAFGIQSGRGAMAGMIAAAIIPIISSIFGGTRIQASGPTAPMTSVSLLVITYAYTHYASYSNLAEGFITLVFLLTAVIMILSGLFRLGKLISYVPNLVVLGFMNGIAVLIWWDQLKKLFGIGGSVRLTGDLTYNLIFALGTFILILVFPTILRLAKVPERIRVFIPATLVAIVAMTYILVSNRLNLQTVNLGNDVNLTDFNQLILKYIPTQELFTLDTILRALGFALQLALLGYLDSLLTSMVIDKMTKEKTNKDRELFGQGLANGVSAIFGGIPGAQATIRSVILVREGAQSRLAGVMVGVFTLLGILLFKELIILVASSIFIGVLLKAGLDVFEKDFIKDYFAQRKFKNANFNWQMALVILTTLLTVIVDLNVAVIFGTSLFYILKWKINLSDVINEEAAIPSEL